MAKAVAPLPASRTLRRPPTAFAMFLKSQRGLHRKFQRVRYCRKTSVFRMDLLKMKFDSLSPDERSVFLHEAAAAAKATCRPTSAVAAATSPCTFAPAIAGGPGGPHVIEEPAASFSPISALSSARATRGSGATVGVASSVTFTDIASGMQKVYNVVPNSNVGAGGWGLVTRWKTSQPAAGCAASLTGTAILVALRPEIICLVS